MFIDFLTLMLINMTAGLFILAAYLIWGLDDQDQGKWAPAFGTVGLLALACGLRMAWTWPLPGSFNCAYGELSVLFGALFAATAVAMAKGWNLIPIALYAFFAGLAAIVTGARFVDLGMSQMPVLTGAGFVLTGLGGILAAPALMLRARKIVRIAGALTMAAAGAIWALTGYGAIWMHLEAFEKWTPK